MSSSDEDTESSKLTIDKEGEEQDYKRIFSRKKIDQILGDNTTDDHKDILCWIKENKLCLNSKEKESGDSLIKILLEEVGNGHGVVESVLDTYISQSCSNPNSNQYNIEMDFTGLMDHKTERTGAGSGLWSTFRCSKIQSRDSVLDDIVKLKLKYQEHFWTPYTKGFKKKKENCSKSFLGKI